MAAALTLGLIRYTRLDDFPTDVDAQAEFLTDVSNTYLMDGNIMSQILEREEKEMKGKCATAEFDFIFVLDASGFYFRLILSVNIHAIGRNS